MLLLRRIQTTIALLLILVSSTAFAVEEGDKVPAFDFASIYADKPNINLEGLEGKTCLLYTSPSPRDATLSRMPSSA